MATDIVNYHFQSDNPEKLQFGMNDFSEHEKNKLCLSMQPHSHSFYQIIWFKNVKGKHYVDFEGFEIGNNTLFFIAKNQVHFFEPNNNYEGYLMHFNEPFILSNEKDINFFLTYQIFNNKNKPFFEIPYSLGSTIDNYFEQIKKELNNTNEFGNAYILSNLLKSMLLVVEREMRKDGFDDKANFSGNSNYLKFRNALETNFKLGWTVADYANELAITTKTLNTLIKSETGKTVSQFISDRVILEAKRQLAHTNSLVNQIAYDLGFQDPYYFVRYFKKHLGCSPTEFRKSIS